jgi:hypothetical protein
MRPAAPQTAILTMENLVGNAKAPSRKEFKKTFLAFLRASASLR